MKILISAGEASGDRYAAGLVEALRKRIPTAEFFGCAGRLSRQAGVHPVVRAEDLAVVGIFEVVRHIPRIHGEFQKLIEAAETHRPAVAILVDSPDFNLRAAKRLAEARIPVVYYVAPQVWAWRRSRIRQIRESVDLLLCIFPFEEKFFRSERIRAAYVGHPLAHDTAADKSKEEFFQAAGLDLDRPAVALLPGSREGEAERHLPPLMEAVRRLRENRDLNFILPASSTTGRAFFEERISEPGVHIIEGEAANALAHAGVSLVASGSATVEAALLNAPMVVFYKVSGATWLAGKLLVDSPFYSMVNLLAGRAVVPELIQNDCTGEKLAAEAERLLEDEQERDRMRASLESIARDLRRGVRADEQAAEMICAKIRSGFSAQRNYVSPIV